MTVHPQQVGRFSVDRVLGSGGMATVYKSQMTTGTGFTKQVALKLLHPHLVQEKDFLKMFMDEARITADLVHGNIVPVFDSGEVDGFNYIAMEYIDGMDLSSFNQRWLKKYKKPLDPGCLCYVITQITCGLQYAHNKADSKGRKLGIVHRDLSPQNILLSHSGEVKIADFGIALARNRLTVSEVGVLKGKRRYMSPEQLSGRALDARSDLYSLALMAYELMIGEGPFTGRDGLVDFVPSVKAKALLSRSMLRFFKRALAPNPDDRFQTSDQFRDGIRDATGKEAREFAAINLRKMMAELAAIPDADLEEESSSGIPSHLTTANGPLSKKINTREPKKKRTRKSGRPKTKTRRHQSPSLNRQLVTGAERGARRVALALALIIAIALITVVTLQRPKHTPLKTPRGTIRVTSDWPIEVVVDKDPLGSTPIDRKFPKGEYQIKLIDRATGWQRVIKRKVRAGKVTAIHLSAR